MQKEYDLMGNVIGFAMQVYRVLGPGFLESVYHKALEHELTKAGIPFESKKQIIVWYDEIPVGEFEADFLVSGDFIVEIKAVQNLAMAHEIQTVNYLNAIRKDTGLLLNFGAERLEFKKKFRKSAKAGIF
ncbi:MAG TPA: GxxExxY protein [Verrucomicrobiae bacterium]|nr:GxxExxY protein [Verrucomicrobiae bacterium]